MKTSYLVYTDDAGKMTKVRYFVKEVPVQQRDIFNETWINLGFGGFAKDAANKIEAIAIIAELKGMGINC